jgi:hypothetical protein
LPLGEQEAIIQYRKRFQQGKIEGKNMKNSAEYMKLYRQKTEIFVNGVSRKISFVDLQNLNNILFGPDVNNLQTCKKFTQIDVRNLQGDVRNLQGENGENTQKTAILAENVNFLHAKGGKGGFLNLNNSTSTHTGTVTYSSCVQEKEKINKKEKIFEDFEIFWKAWPRNERKVNKEGAKKSFCRAFEKNKGLTFETILKALEWWKNSNKWQKDNGEYIPMPTTWLNQCHWEALENIPSEKPPEKRIEQMPPPSKPKAEERVPGSAPIDLLFSGLTFLKPRAQNEL